MFRTLWASQDVRLHRSGVKRFFHPAVGSLALSFGAMAIEAGEGLTLTAYTAPPGTPAHDGPALLATWAATNAASDPTPTPLRSASRTLRRR